MKKLLYLDIYECHLQRNVFVDVIDECQNITVILLKFLLFCCFDFDCKISIKYIYLVYHLFYFILNCCMVHDFDHNITLMIIIDKNKVISVLLE